MRLSEALVAKSNLMLRDDLMPDRFVGPRTPEELLEEVVQAAERAIRALKPGESITVALQDDQRTPWMLTWRSEPTDVPDDPGIYDGDNR